MHGDATAKRGEQRELPCPIAITTLPVVLSESRDTLLKSKHGGAKKKRAPIVLE